MRAAGRRGFFYDLPGLIANWAVLDLLGSPKSLMDRGLIPKDRGDRICSTNRALMIAIDSPRVAKTELKEV